MIEIRVDDEKVISVLTKLSLGPSQKANLFDEIGINLVENAQLRFIDGVDPDGNAWPKSLRVIEFGGQTLIDKGTLRSSLTHNVLVDGVEYGTNVPYATALNDGAEIKATNAPYLAFKIGDRFSRKKSVTIPKRTFVGISNEDELMVIDVVNSFLLRQMQ